MKNAEIVKELWTKFSQGNYVGCEALLHENLKVLWPTSREIYEGRDDFITVNEAFGKDWTFDILSLEETMSDKVISVVHVSSPSCPDSFYATSIFSFASGVITNMETYWAFQDKQPEWRRTLSKVY
ncbi:hypothetical protein E8A66_09715 [Vibrio cholerae]|uniref:nuclear transport factor 2 family protein n=1 Tax=Vibrio cholerae TaxID=666 RepID=UPI000E0A73C5|nr:hypothetical protein [Vibrio cholerae]EGR0541741.1 hypothetical protein [Vibrio cholerae]EGR2509487.1 hypothetical protein [Vibrio cholerae]EGR4344210.1 hypothetical protein [Vibrio cholerae]EGR5064127.1 hypothetical protein [Vibrio cholerae]EJL6590128.1 hypothetical protein [Vibrio cholerae]